MTIIRWMRRTTTGRCRIWVIRVVFTHSRSLPVFPYKQTCRAPTGMSQKCQERKFDPRTGNICRQRKRPMFATPPRHGLVMI
jgi:hypothetical protein